MACEKVKAWLSHAGVPFIAQNVDQDDAAYDALVATGFRTVPVTLIAGRTIVGYQPDALAEALSALGPSSPE